MKSTWARPSRTASLIGAIGFLLFIPFGLATNAPAGMIVFLIAGAAFGFYQAYSARGIRNVLIEDESHEGGSALSVFEAELRSLERLHRDGLLTDEEYAVKRKQLIDRP